MAKYHITHACGHVKIHNIISKGDKREWRISCLESEICADCLAVERAKENEANAQKNAEAGLPELIGTPKQIAWAETIRQKCYQDFKHFDLFVHYGITYKEQPNITTEERTICDEFVQGLVSCLKQCEETIRVEAKKWLESDDGRKELLQKVTGLIEEETSASFWINHRANVNKGLGHAMGVRIARIVSEIPYDKDKQQRILMREAMREATIFPNEKTESFIAEVRIETGVLTLICQPNQNLYNELVNDIGFKSIGVDAYRLMITERHGDINDVSAELIAKLIEKGYPVRCFDEHVRQKALDGNYEPYNKKWISETKKDGRYVVIPHFRDDVLYHKIRKIKGSKWDNACIVPIERYEDIFSFAKINNYRISRQIQEILDQEAKFDEEKVMAVKVSKSFKSKRFKEVETKVDDARNTVNPELVDD